MFMQSLENHLNECNNRSVTENGAVGYKSTGKALLDLNFFNLQFAQRKRTNHYQQIRCGLAGESRVGFEVAVLCQRYSRRYGRTQIVPRDPQTPGRSMLHGGEAVPEIGPGIWTLG